MFLENLHLTMPQSVNAKFRIWKNLLELIFSALISTAYWLWYSLFTALLQYSICKIQHSISPLWDKLRNYLILYYLKIKYSLTWVVFNFMQPTFKQSNMADVICYPLMLLNDLKRLCYHTHELLLKISCISVSHVYVFLLYIKVYFSQLWMRDLNLGGISV